MKKFLKCEIHLCFERDWEHEDLRKYIEGSNSFYVVHVSTKRDFEDIVAATGLFEPLLEDRFWRVPKSKDTIGIEVSYKNRVLVS